MEYSCQCKHTYSNSPDGTRKFSNPVEKYFHKPKIKSVWCKCNEVKIFKYKLKSKKIRRDINIDIS